jgi:hypothetical protein
MISYHLVKKINYTFTVFQNINAIAFVQALPAILERRYIKTIENDKN